MTAIDLNLAQHLSIMSAEAEKSEDKGGYSQGKYSIV